MAKCFETDIQCSNCGFIKTIPNVLRIIDDTVEEGWGSFGHALYCPECTRTWHERNNTEMADKKNTFTVIASMVFKTYERIK